MHSGTERMRRTLGYISHPLNNARAFCPEGRRRGVKESNVTLAAKAIGAVGVVSITIPMGVLAKPGASVGCTALSYAGSSALASAIASASNFSMISVLFF